MKIRESIRNLLENIRQHRFAWVVTILVLILLVLTIEFVQQKKLTPAELIRNYDFEAANRVNPQVKVYVENEEYFVEVRDPILADPQKIRKMLNIPDGIELKIIVPAAAYGSKGQEYQELIPSNLPSDAGD